MSRGLLVIIFSLFSFHSFAGEYAVGFSSQNFKKINFNNKNNRFNHAGKNIRVLKNLEMIIIESDKDISKDIKADPMVEFVDALTVIKGPEKRFSLPFETLNHNQEMQTPWGILAVEAPLVWEETNAAAGINVLVLDTGIDKDHPNIASRFIEGRDLIGRGSDDLPYPFFDEQGHGTHVAGTILADGGTGGVVGVAPGASLYVGKVCNNGCPGGAILAGVDWAIEAKMHVVNMSLGGRFSSSSAERAYQKAEDNNVVIVAASGNDGLGSVGYPAGYNSVLSVGAISENREIASFSNWGSNLDVVAPGVDVLSSYPRGTGRAAETTVNFSEDNQEEALNSLAIDGSIVGDAKDLPIVYVGLGQDEDYEGLDLTGKIALVSRGEITFGDKARGAISAGAEAIIIFNNVPNESLNATFGASLEITGTTLTLEEGMRITQALENTEAGSVLTGSVSILATDFGTISGTSMATPHTSGVAALVRAINPDLNASEVKDIIRNTAVPSMNDNSENKYGNGLVNAVKAVEMAKSVLP